MLDDVAFGYFAICDFVHEYFVDFPGGMSFAFGANEFANYRGTAVEFAVEPLVFVVVWILEAVISALMLDAVDIEDFAVFCGHLGCFAGIY